MWAAAVSSGMIAVIHVGNTASDFSGWADIGWDPGRWRGRRPDATRQHAADHAAQNLIASMLYGGVFARHPELTVVLEEMKVGWVPSFVDTASASRAVAGLGDWPYDVSAAATCSAAT